MKTITLIFLLVFFSVVNNINAQINIPLNSENPGLKILEINESEIIFSLGIISLDVFKVNVSGKDFITVNVPGFVRVYDTGNPQLPVLSELMEIPYCENIEIEIISIKPEIVDLHKLGFNDKIIPCQPSISKNKSLDEVEFFFNKKTYNRNSFNNSELITIKKIGVLRGVNIAGLVVSPFCYNPVKNILKVNNNIVFKIRFNKADPVLTENQKSKYYSPDFEPLFNNILNHSEYDEKDIITKYPVKYLIVSLSAFKTILKPFAEWKTRKGFYVIEKYYPTPVSQTVLKNYLDSLYNAGTPSDPAPTYVLFAGDVAQIPPDTGRAFPPTKTDLYYFTFDSVGDYFPDMYYGRFSANWAAQLQPQVDKTIEYEQYAMPDPSYLDTAVLIAGNDAVYAQVWANGQINYLSSLYFNTYNNFFPYIHLYPDSNDEDTIIRNELNRGCGFATYTGHGTKTGWSDPLFDKNDIPQMFNSHQYGFFVGNCCLSNTFNEFECFGEALLRASDKGAIGYIGASNDSYWDEDYYWSVGNRSTIVENPLYDSLNPGVYDCLFHSNGEDTSKWFVTGGQMIYAGNLAVESSTSPIKQYYWEIYHLMGDPSVMPYLSNPSELAVAYNNPQLADVSSLAVYTEQDALVAISHNAVLLDVVKAPAGGTAILNFPAFLQLDTADIVVTKQNKQPYIGTVEFMWASDTFDVEVCSVLNPDSSYNCIGVDVSPRIVLKNKGSATITDVVIKYNINSGMDSVYLWTGNLPFMQSDTVVLPAFTLNSGNFVFTVFSENPGGHADENTVNDTLRISFSADTNQLFTSFTADRTFYCDYQGTVAFKNLSEYAKTYLWDFGDGATGYEINPVHTYGNPGKYYVSLIAYDGICGSDTLQNGVLITLDAGQVMAADTSACGSASFTLTASADGIINWYDSLIGGNLINTGVSYVTPLLTSTTNYYLENVVIPAPLFAGNTDSAVNGYYNNDIAENCLIFDAYSPFVLYSAVVNASSSGDRIIKLSDYKDSVLMSDTINIPAGISRIILNFSVPADTGLRISSSSFSDLYCNDTCVDFPYIVSNLLSIKGSNVMFPENKYFYFYDWEIKLPDCSSTRTKLSVSIFPAEPTADFIVTDTGYKVCFTNMTSDAMFYWWDFDDGTYSDSVNPIHTYTDDTIYNVMLIAYNNCGTDTVYHEVDLRFVHMNLPANSVNSISLVPNPVKDKIVISYGDEKPQIINIADITGKILKIYYLPENNSVIDFSEYASGIYYVQVFLDSGTYIEKIIKY